jgi:energy-coupling factor transport system substrate-specific component
MSTVDLLSRAPVIRARGRSALALTVATVIGLVAFLWPFVDPTLLRSHSSDAPWIFVTLLPLCLAVVFAELSDGGIDA